MFSGGIEKQNQAVMGQPKELIPNTKLKTWFTGDQSCFFI